MSKFIEVTHNGDKGLVNIDMIRVVASRDDHAVIRLNNDDDGYEVEETYEEVKAVLEVVNG